MNTILHIISSPRESDSHSLSLGNALVRQTARPDSRIIVRDLGKDPPPFVSRTYIRAVYKEPSQRNEAEKKSLAYSDTIIQEVKEADTIVIGTPTHNFGIAASLKAWIDQVVRPGASFAYNKEGGKDGFFYGKKVYLAVASGGASPRTASGETPPGMDFTVSYIELALAQIGLTDIHTLRVEETAQKGAPETEYEDILNAAI